MLKQSLLTLGLASSIVASANEVKPNIIYILLDDAGFGDFSFNGQKKFQTPNIDKLAQEGISFNRHYTGSPVCSPSRCVLLTGYHTGHASLRGNKANPIKNFGQYPLPADTITFAHKAKEANYATGAFGKWGLGEYGTTGAPDKMGFDEFYGYTCQAKAHNNYPKALQDNEKVIKLDGKTYTHDLIMDRAFKFIEKNQEKPFLLFLPVTIPHAALQVPEEYAAPFRKKFPQFENKIGRYSHKTQIRNPEACFAGMMTKLDEDIGRLEALLEQLNIDDNTIIMLASDNGPHKEGGKNPNFTNSGGGLRGTKRDLYEGGVRTVFLAKYPNKIKANSSCTMISGFQDILPTLCDFMGVEAPKGIDGISLKNALLGDMDNQKKHNHLYWEFAEAGNSKQAIVFDYYWKLVKLNLKGKKMTKIELYNLKDDMAEKTNIADKYPEKVAQGLKLMEDSRTECDIYKLNTKVTK